MSLTPTRRMMLTRSYFVLCGALAAGCSASTARPVTVAVVLEDRATVGPIANNAVRGLDLHPLDVPAPPPPPTDVATPVLTRARTAYSQGDFEVCRRELAALDLGELLARSARDHASRALAYEAACAHGAQARVEAGAAAASLARLGLELPDVVLARDVEASIGEAIAAAGAQVRHPLAVTGEPGARLTVDGQPAGCVVPCSVQVRPGAHLFAVETDGFLPSHRWVDVAGEATIAMPQEAAPPQLAGQQWRARVGRGLPPTDLVGATLLAKLAGQPRVAYLHAAGDQQVMGWMIVEGKVVASANRDRTETAALLGDLAYDGGVLRRPAVWKRPWFWIAVSSVALVAAGSVVALTYEPEIVTKVIVE